MSSYRNLVLELLEHFKEFIFFVIPIYQNNIVDALATSASIFKILIYPNKNFEIQVKHKPIIPENVKYWQVFEDNLQIRIFLENGEEFFNTQIDEDNELNEDQTVHRDSVSDVERDQYVNILGGK